MNIKILSLISLVMILSAKTLIQESESKFKSEHILTKLLNQLKKEPENKALQQLYLLNFPNNMLEFKRLFDPPDFKALYDGYEYIFKMNDLINGLPYQVGTIILNIAKDKDNTPAVDATNYFRDILNKFIIMKTGEFIEIFTFLQMKEQENIVRYICDIENYEYYKEFDQIIESLKKINEHDLVNQFLKAKEKRQSEDDH